MLNMKNMIIDDLSIYLFIENKIEIKLKYNLTI